MTFKLNPNAKPFYPSDYVKEQEIMNEFEKQFIKENGWLFEDESESEVEKEH